MGALRIRAFKFSAFEHLDSATSCHVKTQVGVDRHLLLLVFCSCVLLISSAKVGRIGNCMHVNSTYTVLSSFEESKIHGMRTMLFVNGSAMIFPL